MSYSVPNPKVRCGRLTLSYNLSNFIVICTRLTLSYSDPVLKLHVRD